MRHKNTPKFCWETSDRVPPFYSVMFPRGNSHFDVIDFAKSLPTRDNSRFTKEKFIYETILVIEQFIVRNQGETSPSQAPEMQGSLENLERK